MTVASNVELVKAFLETNGRDGLAEAIRRYFTDDFIWWTPGTGEIQDRIIDLADIMHRNYDANGVAFALHRTVSEGDMVVAEFEGMGTLTNGTVYNNRYLTLLVIRDGKISQIREYHDSAYADPIWGPIFAEALAG